MIFSGSRYAKTPLVIVDGKTKTFSNRDLMEVNLSKAKTHVFKEGDTLDGIATNYFGNSQLWWVIMDANPKYQIPQMIKVGDILMIPHIVEVNKVL